MFRPTAIALAPALALALCIGSAVRAQTDDGVQVVAPKVHFADLDIATDSGAQRLAFRIRVVAQGLCGGDLLIERRGADFPVCVRRSTVRAAADLGSSKVAVALGVSPEALALAGR
jgi:UrcA family protein